MSGIARIDAQVAAGTVTVRCLLGGFDQPAAGASVTLDLVSPDGVKRESRTATAQAEGRATFDDLSAFIGWRATARATLAGAEVRSGAFELDTRAGSRLLLVAGATAPAGAGTAPAGAGTAPAGPAGAAHGGQPAMKAPALCAPNRLETHPRGTLIVGLVDFGAGGQLQPREGAEVHLRVFPPGRPLADASLQRSTKTAGDGRATFANLDGEEFPAGTQFQLYAETGEASAALGKVGGARRDPTAGVGELRVVVHRPGPSELRSSRFSLGEVGSVVLLTRSCAQAIEQPVADVAVVLRHHEMTGEVEELRSTTDESGVATFRGLQAGAKDLFSAVATYGGAPFSSQFFEIPRDAGARVPLRVFETVADPKVVKSAVQFEFRPREGGNVQVNRVYEVLVTGDRAFWPPGGMAIYGGDAALSFTVMPAAQRYLEHEEGAPYAQLSRPIPPNESVFLSVAYVTPNDGGVHEEIWHAPFPVLKAFGAAHPPQTITGGQSGPPNASPHGQSQVSVHPLLVGDFQPGLCEYIVAAGQTCPSLLSASGGAQIRVEVSGLPEADLFLFHSGLGVAGIACLLLMAGLAFGRRPSELEVLRERQASLEAALRAFGPQDDPERRKAAVAALDGIHRKIDALSASAEARGG